jgi:hypothetical protein
VTCGGWARWPTMAPLFRGHRPRRLRHHLVQAAGVSLIGSLVAMALLPSGFDIADMSTGGEDPAVRSHLESPADAYLVGLMKRYRCSTDGFGQEEIPQSAIIRRAQGQIAVVSFDRGWEVFQDDGPESLVAVCLRPPH